MKLLLAAVFIFGSILGDSSAFANDTKPRPVRAECTYYQDINRGEIKTQLLEKGQPILFQVDGAQRENKSTTVHIKMLRKNEISLITTSQDETLIFSSTAFQLGEGFEHYVNVTGERSGFINIKCVPVDN